MTNCCDNIRSNTELITSSSMTDNNSIFQDENSLKQIPQIKDLNEGIDFIISKESYQILIKKIPKNIFVKKLCQNLNPQNIFYLIKEAINWILLIETEKKDKKIKKYISMIQNYTKFGTKKIIDELESLNINNKLKKEDEGLLLQSLSDWVMLIELILFLNKSGNNNNYGPDFSCKNMCSVYDINLWYNKNMEEVIKRYAFEGCYYLLQIKMKYSCEKKNFNKILKTPSDIKVNKDSINEVKKLFFLIEDFIKELSNEM